MKIFKYSILGSIIATVFATPAFATNGYFSHGYGVKSQGMGGVGIALPQDALAAASNPAGLALVGDRLDLGLTWFRPDREATISGNGGGGNGTFEGNAREDFFIPEFGYNKVINDQLTLGVSVYGNGGMNTSYEKGGIPLFNGGNGVKSGIDYIQVFVAPTATWKITPSQSVGVAINLGYQRFKAQGIENFKGISTFPNNLTGQGTDDAYGIGLHFGWIGQVTDAVTLGATYQTKTYFEKFDKYKGLFAGNGNMDAPATAGVGISIKTTPQLTLAFDIQRYFYSDVDSIGNALSRLSGANLGSSTGPGFGWQDINAYKLGASYAVNDALTVRAGYDHADQPIPGSEALFNILAPGVVQDHLTFGGTYKLPNNNGEISLSYVHAFSNDVKGVGAIPASFGSGDVNLKMSQDSFGIAYGYQF